MNHMVRQDVFSDQLSLEVMLAACKLRLTRIVGSGILPLAKGVAW